MQEVGLSGAYQRDQVLSLTIKALPALAFVPPEMVNAYFGTAAQLLENIPTLTAEEQVKVTFQASICA